MRGATPSLPVTHSGFQLAAGHRAYAPPAHPRQGCPSQLLLPRPQSEEGALQQCSGKGSPGRIPKIMSSSELHEERAGEGSG